MREQIHHETVTPAEWLFCSDGLLPCFRDNETGIRNGPAFFQQARRAPLHGSPMQPACQTAGSPTGRPPRHPQQRSPTSRLPAASGAAPPHNNPRRSAAQPPFDPTSGGQPDSATQTRFTATPDDRSRNGGQTGTAATRRAAVPCALSHNSPEPPRPAIHSGAAPLHNNPRRPAAQPPLHGHPATGHEMAGKPARQPPAGPPRPAVPLHNPPGHQRAPPFPSGKSAYQFPRLARPPPPGNANHAPGARCPPPPGNANQPPGARRCACPTATSVPWRGHPARAASPRKERGGPPKIYFFSSPNTP